MNNANNRPNLIARHKRLARLLSMLSHESVRGVGDAAFDLLREEIAAVNAEIAAVDADAWRSTGGDS